MRREGVAVTGFVFPVFSALHDWQTSCWMLQMLIPRFVLQVYE